MKSILKKSLLGRVACLAAAVMAATPANALTFNLLNVIGAEPGTAARRGFDVAAAYWSSVLTSNATINLQIGFTQLGTGVLGQTGTNARALFNSQVYDGLRRTADSQVDATALANLQPLGKTLVYGDQTLAMTTNALNDSGTGYIDTATRFDNDKSINNVALNATTSQIKALGIQVDANGQIIGYDNIDGLVAFNTGFDFDFDPTDGIGAGQVDFIGVAVHEIGHALGFISSVDLYDAYTGPNGNARPGALEGAVTGTILDLFRYSAPGMLDWSTQNTPYFSIDGGKTQVFGDSRFSTGVSNGDGRQGSHWKDVNPPIGMMDPTIAYREVGTVTALDLVAFDAMGWKMASDPLNDPSYRMTTGMMMRNYLGTAVPEPATWAMMIAGLGLVGFAMRRRRRAEATTGLRAACA